METLKLYKVAEHYISFLHSRDNRVQYNKGQRRPYVGVVLAVGNYRYFVPMESPKQNHKNIKPGVHIMPIDGGKMGLLGFNNMIPLHHTAVIEFDIAQEADLKYAALLRHQISFLNRHKADVLNHAMQTYIKRTSGRNGFLNRICCDFKALERACKEYNTNHKRRPKKGGPNGHQ